MCQILLEETSDSPLSDPAGAEDGLIAVHTLAIDSPARQTTNGEGVICSICFFATNMKKSFIGIADTNAGSSEPIQPDAVDASSAVPPLLTEAITEKVLYLLCHPLFDKPIQPS